MSDRKILEKLYFVLRGQQEMIHKIAGLKSDKSKSIKIKRAGNDSVELYKKLHSLMLNQQAVIQKLAGVKVSLGQVDPNMGKINPEMQKKLEAFYLKAFPGEKFLHGTDKLRYGYDGRLGMETQTVINKAKRFFGLNNSAGNEEVYAKVNEYLKTGKGEEDPFELYHGSINKIVIELNALKDQLLNAGFDKLKVSGIEAEVKKLLEVAGKYAGMSFTDKNARKSLYGKFIDNAKIRAEKIKSDYGKIISDQSSINYVFESIPTFLREVEGLKVDPKAKSNLELMKRLNKLSEELKTVNATISNDESVVSKNLPGWKKYVDGVKVSIDKIKTEIV